jgi:hypothetical protein
MRHEAMTDNYQENDVQNSAGLVKDPKDWKSGDDPATPSQLSYLNTLATQAGEEAPKEDLTKAEASVQIDRLREEAGVED